MEDLKNMLNNIVRNSRNGEIKKTRKIYLAGPWFTDKANEIYMAVESIVVNSFKGSKYDVYFPRENSFENAKETFISNVKEIKSCDVVIALIDEKDVGTAWEIGMAYAMKKPVYLLGVSEESFKSKTNIMLAYAGKCFTIDKLQKFMFDEMTSKDFTVFDESWEGKE